MQAYYRFKEDFQDQNIQNEPLLDPEEARDCLYPIRWPAIWDCFQDQNSLYWTVNSVKLEGDRESWERLDQDTQFSGLHFFAFFAVGDHQVNMNLSQVCQMVTAKEAVFAYNYQAMIENVHEIVYADILVELVRDVKVRQNLFNSIETMPCIARKVDWCQKWINSDLTYAHKIVAFAVVEGVFFSSAFAFIFYLKTLPGNPIPGVIQANHYIQRDESRHVEMACVLSDLLKNKLLQSVVYQMIEEAVQVEQAFVEAAMPKRLLGMNADSMIEHVRFTADQLLVRLGYPKKYHAECPFDFMLKLGMWSKPDFFVVEGTNYSTDVISEERVDDDAYGLIDLAPLQ